MVCWTGCVPAAPDELVNLAKGPMMRPLFFDLNVIRRWLAMAVPAGLLWFASTGLAQAQTKLVAAGSEVVFVSKQMGVPVEGRFNQFDAQVDFDPKKPAGGRIAIRIDLASVSLGAPEVQAELAKPEWLDTARFPQAHFQSSVIKSVGAGRFDVSGKLSIKGLTQDVLVPVSVTQAGGLSTASGSFVLKRLAFKVGAGDWADPSLVADDVQVKFKLVLTGLSPL